MNTTLVAFAALLLVLPIPRSGGPALGTSSQATRHVVTVLVPTLDDDSARALVIRRPDLPGNLILITEETTPQEFLNALRALNRSRRELGEAPGAELRAFIRRADRGGAPDPTALAAAAEHLARVKAAPERAIDGVGSYRAATTSLPAVQR